MFDALGITVTQTVSLRNPGRELESPKKFHKRLLPLADLQECQICHIDTTYHPAMTG
jgi:hypothetical protein